MKKTNKKQKPGLLFLFLQFFSVLFVGFCICSILGVAIRCIFNGFDDFFIKIIEPPYLLYLAFSLIISSTLLLVICRKTK